MKDKLALDYILFIINAELGKTIIRNLDTENAAKSLAALGFITYRFNEICEWIEEPDYEPGSDYEPGITAGDTKYEEIVVEITEGGKMFIDRLRETPQPRQVLVWR